MQSKQLFLIGTGRNGSTLISDIVAHHPSLSWVSNYQDKVPAITQISYLNRLFVSDSARRMGSTLNTKNKKNYFARVIPRHSEAYNFWNTASNMNFSTEFMANQTASEEQKSKILHAVKQINSANQSDIFFSKLTGPPRVSFIQSVFPNAQFIHIIRDFRSVVKSYLTSWYWEKGNGFTQPWWKNILSDEDLEIWKNNPRKEVLAALQIKNIVQQSIQELTDVNSSQQLLIQYEEFLVNPLSNIEQILNQVGLQATEQIKQLIIDKNIYNKGKTPPYEDDKVVMSILEPCLKHFNYI